MKRPSLQSLVVKLRICIAALVLTILSLVLFSFTIQKMNEDFLKQLGIEKADADKKITNSILGGYLDAYGLKNAKNIALGNRTAVAKDLLVYTKQFVGSASFKKEYESLRQNNKPQANETPQTPEVFRAELIKRAKEYVTQTEELVKNATPDTKKIFEKSLADAKANLKTTEDPNNEMLKIYQENYGMMVKSNDESNAARLKEWEAKYPVDPQLFIKTRLVQFLEETKDIDFNAQLTELKGKKVFVNQEYEKRRSNRWKMAFRAGKEVVEPARAFVQQWITEIK